MGAVATSLVAGAPLASASAGPDTSAQIQSAVSNLAPGLPKVALEHGTQAVAVLKDRAAPNDISFTVRTPGVALALDPIGGIRVSRRGKTLGRISAPWALDASGRSLPTSYRLVGSTIVQHVNTTGAKFPVATDPHYTWGWVTGTVYFNRQETRTLAIGAAVAASFANSLPRPYNYIVGGAARFISSYAASANNVGACVKVKSDCSPGPLGE